MKENKMREGDYGHQLGMHIFKHYIDVPFDFEILEEILITQLYHNDVVLMKAKSFAKLIFNIYEKWQFKMKFDYEPFNNVRFDDEKWSDPTYSEPFHPEFDTFNFTVTIKGYKPITVNIKDNLDIKGFGKLMVKESPTNLIDKDKQNP